MRIEHLFVNFVKMFVFFIIVGVVGVVSGNVYGPIVSKQECSADSIQLTLAADRYI